jgi:hypothetical protein
MKILKTKKFKIHIYSNDHPPPHCHVRYNDNSEISVDLPLIIPRYGATISNEVREFIEKNLDKIYDAWEKIHPPRKYKIKK